MNSIRMIHPYRTPGGGWAFDDSDVGLRREAFVAGADTLLDRVAGSANNLTVWFSDQPFPGSTITLDWLRGDFAGNWYSCPALDLECWLCGALLRYFEAAPKTIFVKTRPYEPG